MGEMRGKVLSARLRSSEGLAMGKAWGLVCCLRFWQGKRRGGN